MLYKILPMLFLIWMGCSSTHPITEAPYTDLNGGVDGVRLDDFPHSIIGSIEWADLASPNVHSIDEEFQIAVKSNQPPHYLFRINNEEKDTVETILYWTKYEGQLALRADKNMQDHLSGTCEEFKNAGIYEYCIPQFSKATNLNNIFSNLVNFNIWTLPNDLEFDELEREMYTNWSIMYQIRAGMNYRSFQHNNPDTYVHSTEALNLMAIDTQLKQIAMRLIPADNHNIYKGITSGIEGAVFKPCNNNETWRFNGNIADLGYKNGFPMSVLKADSVRFLVKLEGTVQDVWISQRNSTGFTKVISPISINSLTTTSATECD